MTLRDALRQDWIQNNQLDSETYEMLAQQHPDERAMRCPNDLFVLPQDVEYRYGSGYVLGDGAWYDPITQNFFYLETVYEPTGEVRFQL